jgi:hypothetical protein
LVSARNHGSSSIGSGASPATASVSTTAYRASSGVTDQALPGRRPSPSAEIQTAWPAASKATASGCSKAGTQTAAAAPGRKNAVPVPGEIQRSNEASTRSTTK